MAIKERVSVVLFLNMSLVYSSSSGLHADGWMVQNTATNGNERSEAVNIVKMWNRALLYVVRKEMCKRLDSTRLMVSVVAEEQVP